MMAGFRMISSALCKARVSPCCSSYFRYCPFSSLYSGSDGKSMVYEHKLQYQSPSSVKWEPRLCNRVSFIGCILLPLKRAKNNTTELCVHTVLRVGSSPDRSFEILLKMWDQVAEVSSKHLKQDDLVYVSGSLGSYTKVDANGEPRLRYKVTVEELNFVAPNGRFQSSNKAEKTEAIGGGGGTSVTSGDGKVQKERDRLYLWQVFFSNPCEWWDNRKKKANRRHPDFKHKDTGECLWLNPGDPPWVRRQLQVLDSRMAEQGYHEFPRSRPRPRVSTWKYED